MGKVRTGRSYTKLPDLDVSAFAGGVIAGLTGNASFPKPPVAPADLGTLKSAFDEAIIAAAEGGTLQTAQKDAARAALITALNKDAAFVDINCNEELATLLSSGYEPVNSNHTRVTLEAPVIISAMNGPQSGEIKLRVKGDPHRRAIQGRIKSTGGEFGPVITFKGTRDIIFDGLAAGTTYVMQLVGIGGNTGQSDWSDPVTRVAT